VRLHRLDVDRFLIGVRQHLHPGGEEGVALDVFGDLDPPEPLDENAHALVGILEHLEDASRRAPGVEALRWRRFLLGVLLSDQAEHPLARQRALDELQRAPA
jgi:hypothetical protein